METLFDMLAAGQVVPDVQSFESKEGKPAPAATSRPAADLVDESGTISAPTVPAPDLDEFQRHLAAKGGSIGDGGPFDYVDHPFYGFLQAIIRRPNYPTAEYSSWYLAADAKTVAFLESANGLHVKDSQDPNALKAALMLAHERGWIPAKIHGSPKFCGRAFLVACELGLPISGYLPTAEDLKQLEARGLSIPSAEAKQAAPLVSRIAADNDRVAVLAPIMRCMNWMFSGSRDEAIRERGSEQLDRILDGIEKLAASSPKQAGKLWDEHAPSDFYRPHFLPPAESGRQTTHQQGQRASVERRRSTSVIPSL